MIDMEISKIDFEQVDSDKAGSKKYYYTINGKGEYPRKYVPYNVVLKFIELNPQLSYKVIIDKWSDVGSYVKTKEQYDESTDKKKDKRHIIIHHKGSDIYVKTHLGDTNNFTKFYENVNDSGLGIKIEKIEFT